MSLTIAQTLAAMSATQTRKVTKSTRVGDQLLSRDNVETRQIKVIGTKAVEPVSKDPQVILALAILAWIKKADPRGLNTANSFGLPTETLALSTADAAAKLEEILVQAGECTAMALDAHRDNCADAVRAAIAGGTKISKAYGPAAIDLLTLAMSADCASICGSMATAKQAVAKQAAADKAKADAAAARKAALAGKASKPAAPVTDPKAMKAAFAAFMATYKAA